jgi:hypothetical protein
MNSQNLTIVPALASTTGIPMPASLTPPWCVACGWETTLKLYPCLEKCPPYGMNAKRSQGLSTLTADEGGAALEKQRCLVRVSAALSVV